MSSAFVSRLFVSEQKKKEGRDDANDCEFEERRPPTRVRTAPTGIDRAEEKPGARADAEKAERFAGRFRKEACDQSGRSRVKEAAAETGEDHGTDRFCVGSR